ncbi:tetrahydrofolylpolyglutamate synthase [Tieghemostelium lacteum]|uniref:Folylpolyglutamate synthase n=1 Tax=Tieghemostelium lacteum TaxID=361077 RepID=A0A152A5L6_TIELA|nr:tetrahydrofolylpolyglutamate synthase [Tieghemostelium lacteum]|eukprot:KYR01519.1 tetrahydrofolylpolyglutamate synthase [Tieghemostelium lacteum]
MFKFNFKQFIQILSDNMIPLYQPKSRNYEESIKSLLSLQSNASTMTSWINERKFNKAESEKKLRDELVQCIDIMDIDLGKQQVIHVAGTKGKGSTCALTESILRNQGFTTGLFTSPHLISPRERIRINGQEISKEKFSQYFWMCWDKLITGPHGQFNLPFFRFLTVMALKVFQEEGVNCTVLEVGIGGRVDSTNIIPQPVVTGISSLGYDHMNVLGNTLAEIASEKAGIMKPGIPVFTVPQPDEAMQVLKSNSEKVGSPFSIVPPFEGTLSLEGDHQRENASLAIALANCFCIKQNSKPISTIYNQNQNYTLYNYAKNNYNIDYFKPLPESFIKGLSTCQWPGRAQYLKYSDKLELYLDGAHTPESALVCLNWWKSVVNKDGASSNENQQQSQYILMFTCTGGRSPKSFLQPFIDAWKNNEIPAFTQILIPEFDDTLKHITPHSVNESPLTWEKQIEQVFNQLLDDANITPRPKIVIEHIQSVIQYCTNQSKSSNIKVLSTGSLYLIGGLLKSIQGDE